MSHSDQQHTFGRRGLLQGAAALGSAALLAGGIADMAHAAAPAIVDLKANDVILFQGDSITDAGRNKDEKAANDLGALGRGYAMMLSTALLGAHAPLKLQCYNRGISGNKVPDLQGRWQPDALDLKPRVLSILIGVNDIWHKLNGKYDGTVADYESGFTALIGDTKKNLPDVTLVICEPFVLHCGAINDTWFPEFDERRAVAKRVAEAAGAAWVPFQTMFDAAVSEDTPPEYWAADGVHPTTAGHALMAQTWRDVTGL